MKRPPAIERYKECRRRLKNEQDASKIQLLRSELDLLWQEMTSSEKEKADTCPGCPSPFSDAT